MSQIECKIGNTLDLLKDLDNESVQLVVTSPPYWGLRDYGVDGQIGLEKTFDDYIKKLLKVSSEIKRVLRSDGCFYLNIGDTYGGSGCGTGGSPEKLKLSKEVYHLPKGQNVSSNFRSTNYNKCLLGIPWRITLKMIDEQGWILRNDIIWHKPNHMPSSVRDRFTNAYEHIFMLVKNKKYYFNLDAVREPHLTPLHNPGNKNRIPLTHHFDNPNRIWGTLAGKNPGEVWTIETTDNNLQGLTKHEIATDRTGNCSYADPLHQRPLNTKGKNPGDVWNLKDTDKSKSKYLKSDVKSTSPTIRGIRDVLDGKISTTMINRIKDVGQYLKDKLKKSRYSKSDLADILGISLTTLEHYFRSDLWGQLIPPKPVWNALQPLLNLDDYDDYVDEEIRSALPQPHPLGKNPGDLWTINTKPYKEAHFAVFPPELVVKPILSSSRPGDLVLDPFAGSGTVGEVCQRYDRNCLMFEINPDYELLIRKRCHLDSNLERYI